MFVCLSVFYAVYLSQMKRVRIGKHFYFLVLNTAHVEAGIFDGQLSGGAGYLLEYEGREYVALAVYFNEERGIAVQGGLQEEGRLLAVHVDQLYFKTCLEKRKSYLYQGAFDCLYGCMEVLGWEIDRLDNGGTQQSTIRTLEILLRQLRYLASLYEDDFTQCAQVCKRTSETVSMIVSDVVYAKDLRYLLCDMTVEYIRLASKFSL